MRIYKSGFFIAFLIIMSILFFIPEAFAQPDPPPGPESIPLDPLSWVMLAAGGGVAAKKYYDSRNQHGDK